MLYSASHKRLQWIWRHPKLHSCHFPALQPSGRPAISYSKCKLLRLVLKETSISNCACKVWAPQKTHSGLWLKQTSPWSLPEAETTTGGNILGNNVLTLKIQLGLSIPCIKKILRLESTFSASLLPFPPHEHIQPVRLKGPAGWCQHRAASGELCLRLCAGRACWAPWPQGQGVLCIPLQPTGCWIQC